MNTLFSRISSTQRLEADSDIDGNDWLRTPRVPPGENRHDVDTDVEGKDSLRVPSETVEFQNGDDPV